MFRDSSFIVRTIANVIFLVLLLVVIVYGTSLFYKPDASEFIKAIKQPYTMSTLLEKEDHFHPGDGVVIHMENRKIENGCFAEYMAAFSGPVQFQINLGKSRFLDNRGEVHDFIVNTFVDLPDQLPPGNYKIAINAFPTCDGVDRDPFTIVADPIVIEVKK